MRGMVCWLVEMMEVGEGGFERVEGGGGDGMGVRILFDGYNIGKEDMMFFIGARRNREIFINNENLVETIMQQMQSYPHPITQ